MIKLKRCVICGEKYAPRAVFSKVCDSAETYECAKAYGQKQAASKKAKQVIKERKQTREKLDALRKKPELVQLAQKAFNAWVRARDANQPCISCDGNAIAASVGGGWDAGHYRSVGSAVHLRFAPDNCHKQCKHCNKHLAGNHVAYRAALLKRIGLRTVELLEADQTLRKYTREGLIDLAAHYRAEARKLKLKT